MPNSSKPIEPVTTTILNLNDHVLRETFKHLKVAELGVIADVCANLRMNARAAFPKRKYLRIWRDHRELPIQLQQMHCTLRNFGSMVTLLDVTIWPQHCKQSLQIMGTIYQYCGETLRGLRLQGVEFTADLIPTMKLLLQQIQKVDFFHCHFVAGFDASEMFSMSADLRSLSLRYLKEFNLRCHYPLRGIKQFLVTNPQLKELHIHVPFDLSTKNYQSIGQHAPQIEKLRLLAPGTLDDMTQLLKRLTALEWLEIDCQNNSISVAISELVASHAPLKCLHLSNFIADEELFSAISNLKQLKTLEFSSGKNVTKFDVVQLVGCLTELADFRVDAMQVSHVMEIIRGAAKLQYLQLKYIHGGIMDINLYIDILGLVANRNGRGCLEIGLPDRLVDVPQETLKANRNLLKIKTGYGKKPYTV